MNLFNENTALARVGAEELERTALQEARRVIGALEQIPKMNSAILISVLMTAIQIAVKGKEQVNDKEKTLIESVMGKLCSAPLDMMLELLEQPLDEKSFDVVRDMFRLSEELGAAYCNLILCFAYIDGVFEEPVAQRLSEVVIRRRDAGAEE